MDNIDQPTDQTHGTGGKTKAPTTTPTPQGLQNAVSMGFSVEVTRSVLRIIKIVSDVVVFTISETCAEVESAGLMVNRLYRLYRAGHFKSGRAGKRNLLLQKLKMIINQA